MQGRSIFVHCGGTVTHRLTPLEMRYTGDVSSPLARMAPDVIVLPRNLGDVNVDDDTVRVTEQVVVRCRIGNRSTIPFVNEVDFRSVRQLDP